MILYSHNKAAELLGMNWREFKKVKSEMQVCRVNGFTYYWEQNIILYLLRNKKENLKIYEVTTSIDSDKPYSFCTVSKEVVFHVLDTMPPIQVKVANLQSIVDRIANTTLYEDKYLVSQNYLIMLKSNCFFSDKKEANGFRLLPEKKYQEIDVVPGLNESEFQQLESEFLKDDEKTFNKYFIEKLKSVEQAKSKILRENTKCDSYYNDSNSFT